MRGKRLKRVAIPSDAIEDYFSGEEMIIEGLPDDIELVDTWDDPMTQSYNFVFKSSEFPIVEEGEEIPETDIVTANRRIP